MSTLERIEKAYEVAQQRYAELGVDSDRAMDRLAKIAISLHCWQGDDVGGFESGQGLTGGGIMATGAYPGKARTADELRADVDKVMSLLPGDIIATGTPSGIGPMYPGDTVEIKIKSIGTLTNHVVA